MADISHADFEYSDRVVKDDYSLKLKSNPHILVREPTKCDCHWEFKSSVKVNEN